MSRHFLIFVFIGYVPGADGDEQATIDFSIRPLRETTPPECSPTDVILVGQTALQVDFGFAEALVNSQYRTVATFVPALSQKWLQMIVEDGQSDRLERCGKSR